MLKQKIIKYYIFDLFDNLYRNIRYDHIRNIIYELYINLYEHIILHKYNLRCYSMNTKCIWIYYNKINICINLKLFNYVDYQRLTFTLHNEKYDLRKMDLYKKYTMIIYINNNKDITYTFDSYGELRNCIERINVHNINNIPNFNTQCDLDPSIHSIILPSLI